LLTFAYLTAELRVAVCCRTSLKMTRLSWIGSLRRHWPMTL